MIVEENGRYRLLGPITMGTAGDVLDAVRAIAQGHGHATALCLDLGAIGTVDSAALALLFALMRENREAGRTLSLIGVPEALHSLAALYEVAHMLPLEARVTQAGSSYAASAAPAQGAFLRTTVRPARITAEAPA